MKFGFQIEIQSDLSVKQEKVAKAYADSFIINTLKDNKKRYDGQPSGGYTSFFKRGTFGYRFDTNKELVFRRVSKNRRVFAIVKIDSLQCSNKEIDFKNGCVCPKCIGG